MGMQDPQGPGLVFRNGTHDYSSAALRLVQAVLLNFPIKRAPADGQHLSRPLLVPAGGFEHRVDVGALGLGEGRVPLDRDPPLTAGVGLGKKGEVVRSNRALGGRQQRSRHHALQLADVARPGVAGQQLERLWTERARVGRQIVRGQLLRKEAARENGDVDRAFA